MFFYSLKQTLKTLTAVVLSASCAALIWTLGKFSFPNNAAKEEYYLYSPSSQAERTLFLRAKDVLFLEGMSYEYETSDGEAFAQEMIRSFRAVVLETETLDGVTSYYCYSPRLGDTTVLFGCKINLHIAVKGDLVKVGSPIIFGGY